nr:8827_t:CDS:2 [Entrophospora candida]
MSLITKSIKPNKLLLVFIHGFKGDDTTFQEFPERIHNTLTSFYSDMETETIIYPRYETRGDLKKAVEIFCNWLEERVELEEEMLTEKGSSNIKDDSDDDDKEVGNIWVGLIGHSMGGLLAAIGAGATAYLHKEKVSSGIGWLGSHLEFVGVLINTKELKERVETLINVPRAGFHCYYTQIEPKAFGDIPRTFIVKPPEGKKKYFSPASCTSADEIDAHITMFDPVQNQYFYDLAHVELSIMIRNFVIDDLSV